MPFKIAAYSSKYGRRFVSYPNEFFNFNELEKSLWAEYMKQESM
jgi:hypothetical protein